MQSSTIIDPLIGAPIIPSSHPLNPINKIDHTLSRKHINVLTYNLFLRPPGIKDDPYDDYKDERVKEFIKVMPDYDIICLEEVFGLFNNRKKTLINYAKKHGFLYSAECSGMSLFSGYLIDSGLLILSRFPIVANEFQAFPRGHHVDGIVRKGVLYSKIQVKGEMLHLFHTHHITSYTGYTYMLRRGEGFEVWRKFIESCFKKYNYKEGETTLLLGDFNVRGKTSYIVKEQVLHHPAIKKYPHLAEKHMISEYEAMLCLLSDNHTDEIEDLIIKKYGRHFSTWGGIYGSNAYVTLDYIFKFSHKSKHPNLRGNQWIQEEKAGKLKVVDDSVKVEKFTVHGFPFKHLSDHYGLVVSLEYTD